MLYKIEKTAIYMNDWADFKMPYLVYGSMDLQNARAAYQRLNMLSFPQRQHLGSFRGNIFAP